MQSNLTGFWQTLINEEPVAVILAVAATFLLFGFHYVRLQHSLPWFQTMARSVAMAVLFLGMALGGHVFLKSNLNAFNNLYQSFTHYGSISSNQWFEARHTWPGWVTQRELVVNHFVEKEAVATIPATEPSAPALYQLVTIREPVLQNSITGFTGNVFLKLEKERNPHAFNGFHVSTKFKYDVLNQSDQNVETEFLFPLFDTPHILYENIHAESDGREISPLSVMPDGLRWATTMKPRQQMAIAISYEARGMDGFSYAIPDQREVTDFEIMISSNSRDVFFGVDPSGSYIHSNVRCPRPDDCIFIVRIDRVVAAPHITAAFVQFPLPYAPHDLTLRLLRFAPRAVLFLLVVFVFTIAIVRVPFRTKSLLLFQAIMWGFVLLFLVFSPDTENPKMLLLLGSGVTGILVFFILPEIPTLARIAILIWTFLLLGIYPLVSIKNVDTYPENLYDSFVVAGLLVYAFVYSLYTRFRGNSTYQ